MDTARSPPAVRHNPTPFDKKIETTQAPHTALGLAERKRYTMTILKNIPLDTVLKDAQFVLKSVRPRYVYKGEQRSDELEGFSYTVVDTVSYETLTITVLGQVTPAVSAEELRAANEAGEHLFVKPVNAVVTPYIHNRTKSIEDSIKAASISRVAKPTTK